jgi:hypothetical protein
MLARRHFITACAGVSILALAGCATRPSRYSVEEGVRRLLSLSTQRAFDRLLRPGGFYEDEVARISPPDAIDRGMPQILAAILRTNAVRQRLSMMLNDIARRAARRAAPVVIDATRRMPLPDALAVLRGAPTAATDLLRREVDGQLVQVMFPEIMNLLDSDLAEILSAAVEVRTGINYRDLAQTVAGQASDSIFRVIGDEEAHIRADPRSTGDPMLMALLGPER